MLGKERRMLGMEVLGKRKRRPMRRRIKDVVRDILMLKWSGRLRWGDAGKKREGWWRWSSGGKEKKAEDKFYGCGARGMSIYSLVWFILVRGRNACLVRRVMLERDNSGLRETSMPKGKFKNVVQTCQG